MANLEFWRAGGPNDGTNMARVPGIEAEGWDGQMFMDSQSLGADPYALMGAWAMATSAMKIGVGVTNPFTRNLAVTASAAASVQALSGGRAVLGFGRGDSALAWLGYAPVKLAAFEQALDKLQTLLSGGEVSFADVSGGDGAPSAHGLSLGARPEAVRLNWLPEGLPKVPLDVAATGPKVIAMGARVAERLTFSVGADLTRVQWAMDVAEEARREKGLPKGGIGYGVQILVMCHSDPQEALDTAMRYAPPMVRFQVMQGKAVGPQSAGDAENLEVVHKGYDMTKHGDKEASVHLTSGELTPDFVRRFAVVGTPDQCTQRLLELARAGVSNFVIVGPGHYPAHWTEAQYLVAREVIPAVRAEMRQMA